MFEKALTQNIRPVQYDPFEQTVRDLKSGAAQAAKGLCMVIKSVAEIASHAVRGAFTAHDLKMWRESPEEILKGGKNHE